MDTLAVSSRKKDLLKRAKQYYHTQIYVPESNIYVRGLRHEPIDFKDYHSGTEPVVSAEGLYPSAWLTVNNYNALVLNTSNMLIADIDFGDDRLSRHSRARDCNEVCNNLAQIHLLDNELHATDGILFADQSYRVYRTHSGCRVICPSVAVPWNELGWIAQRFMRFLRSDPEYIKLCEIQKCYRARLTPKPWRDTGEFTCVCLHVSTEGKNDRIAPELEEQLRLHDELTLPDVEWAELA